MELNIENYLYNNLIKLGIVIDNEYYYKYIHLLTTIKEEELEDEVCDYHHIVPRCYFKHLGIKVDNSKNNKIKLPISKHILSHYYLYMCSNEDWFRYANLCAITYFLGRKPINEEDIIKVLPEIRKISEEARRLNSIYHSGAYNHNYGKHLSEETKNKIHLTHQLNGKLKRKRKPLSQETKDKIRLIHLGKPKGPMSETHKEAIRKSNLGKHSFTYSEEVREHMSKAHKGKSQSEETKRKRSIAIHELKWYTNGKINVRVKDCPNGFYLGRSKFRKKKVEV